jgi:hypothetical protein
MEVENVSNHNAISEWRVNHVLVQIELYSSDLRELLSDDATASTQQLTSDMVNLLISSDWPSSIGDNDEDDEEKETKDKNEEEEEDGMFESQNGRSRLNATHSLLWLSNIQRKNQIPLPVVRRIKLLRLQYMPNLLCQNRQN